MRTIVTTLALASLAAAPATAGSVSGSIPCGNGCEQMVVYLEGGPAVDGAGTTAVFDQRDKVFIPHVLPVLRGATVEIKNGDPFLHNVHIYSGKETVLNIALPFQGQVIPHVFADSGTYQVLCDAHPEMSAFIVVLETPHYANVATDGSYAIADVPAGSYTLVAHNAKSGEQTRSPVEVQ